MIHGRNELFTTTTAATGGGGSAVPTNSLREMMMTVR